MSKLCQECSKEILSKYAVKFCSSSCSAIYSNRINPRKSTKKPKSCKFCSTDITRLRTERSICNNCLKSKTYLKLDKKKKILLDLTVLEIKDSWKEKSRPWTDRVRGLARSWHKSKGKSCNVCSYDKHVEVCHKKAITSFSDNDTLEIINSLENIVFLCPNCHWEHDNL
jgi:hypothetical protein